MSQNLQDPPRDQIMGTYPKLPALETDVKWKYIFYGVAFTTILVSFIIIGVGNPHNLSNPIDPDGNPCGQGDLQEYPFIYFTNPSKQYLNRTVCVKGCKQLLKQPKQNDKLECYPNSLVKNCNLNLSNTEDRSEDFFIYETQLYLNKICMPQNVNYFKIISDALQINKIDQILSDIYIVFPYLVLFGLLAFCISFATKYIIDQKESIKLAINIFFICSTFGFLILGTLFIFRAIKIASAKSPDDKDVMGDQDQISQNVDSNNSSFVGNILYSLFCFFNCGLFIKSYLELDYSEDTEKRYIVSMRNSILTFISDIIDNQNIIFLPVFAFSTFILIGLIFFRLVLNLFSLGSTKSDDQGLPFEQFQTNPLVYVLMLLLFIGFFWIFIFILQICEYIVYTLGMIEMEEQNTNRQRQKNEKGIFETLRLELSKIIKARVGTIAKCSFQYFVFYIPRQSLEYIDTSYQHKKEQLELKMMVEGGFNDPSQVNVPHTFLMNLQKSISEFYKKTFLKGIQPYGFFYTIRDETNFTFSGLKMQNLIDGTSSWFEEMLDKGELFENQIKYSICFLISIIFLFTIQGNDSLQVSSIMVPVGFMFIISYVISTLYVNMYGSIYSIFILYYLVAVYYKEGYSPNNEQLDNFKRFIQRIVHPEALNQQHQGQITSIRTLQPR